MSLKGKTAVITGGTRGIGLETARNYLKEGVINVILLDVCENEENVQQLKNEFVEVNIIQMLTDVTKRDDVERTFEAILERVHQVDIVVNCAGVVGENDVERTININLIGLINTSLIAMNAMSVANGGKGGIIVNLASVAGLISSPANPVYCASKHGVVGFTRSMASDCYYSKHGVKFTTICPGFTSTPLALIDLPRQGSTPETRDYVKKLIAMAPSQTADQCGKNIAIITATTSNGAVWILDDGRIEEVTIPEYWQPIPAQ